MSICKNCGQDDRYPSGTCKPCQVKRNRARDALGLKNDTEKRERRKAQVNNRCFAIWGLHHANIAG